MPVIDAQNQPLVLHSGTGNPMKAAKFLGKLCERGITFSHSQPSCEQGQHVFGGSVQDTQVRPGFPINGFEAIEAARDWVLTFVRWYNEAHRHSKLCYVTPEQHHSGKADTPQCWSGGICNLSLPTSVILDPGKAVN